MTDDDVAEIEPWLQHLVPRFLENRRADAGRLRQALQAGDFAACATLAHNLKGMGAAYGFPRITVLGEALERATGDKDAAEALRAADELEAYVTHVKVVVRVR